MTAVEIDPDIAKIYSSLYPNDKVIIGDAHQYLLEHYKEYDFIWSSPPCPTHSDVMRACSQGGVYTPKYPDLNQLYGEIILLQHFFKGKYCVENVVSYYDPLIKPQEISKHYFWTNFKIPLIQKKKRNHYGDVKTLQQRKGINLNDFHHPDKRKILRNCVEPETGLHIFECAFMQKQKTLE